LCNKPHQQHSAGSGSLYSKSGPRTRPRTLQVPNIGGNDMKRSLAIALSTAAIGLFVSLTPAAAQVAGNPGDLHTRTLYMKEYGQAPEQAPPGAPAGFLSFLSPGGQDCGVTQDFNGRYTSVCGL
jgi:hypothetical protein